ncbi:MAG: hypothetical protein V3U35_07415, partial [Candidatus Neomarinimicrobiota bacterium]
MRITLIALFLIASRATFPVPAGGQSVSVVITERTVNDFLAAVGPVKGKGKGARKISYDWTVSNPNVDFEQGVAGFDASVKVKTSIITLTDKVHGRLAVDYDAEANKIRMQVVEA